jgi:hypothetical protein
MKHTIAIELVAFMTHGGRYYEQHQQQRVALNAKANHLL